MSRAGQIGTAVESAVRDYARKHGFGDAVRPRLSGAQDIGDVRLCPEIIIECKGGVAAETASPAQVGKWLVETERERVNAGAEVGFLVTKRRGVGRARCELWDAHFYARDLIGLFAGSAGLIDNHTTVTLPFGEALKLLIAYGY